MQTIGRSFTLLWLALPLSLSAQPAPSLGASASFAILGGSITNHGPSRIIGNAGAPTIAGLTKENFVVGEALSDATMRAALRDSAKVAAELAAQPCAVGDLRSPIVHCRVDVMTLRQSLVLEGGPASVWVFQIAGALTTAPRISVTVNGGGTPANVFWLVGGSVEIGEGTQFAGNILATGPITFGRGASLTGRAQTQGGNVVLDTNAIALCCDALVIRPDVLPPATVGTLYSQQLVPIGGPPPYTFSLLVGAPAFKVSAEGLLTGMPAEGTTEVIVMVVDGNGCAALRSDPIPACPLMTLTPDKLPAVVVGVPYPTTTISAAGGTAPYRYSATGVCIDPMKGVICGTPEPIVTITATDALNCSVMRTYPVCTLDIQPATLSAGRVGEVYKQPIAPSGCMPGHTCSVRSAALPDGLTLRSCVISGTPTKEGCFTFIVSVTDAAGNQGTKTYTICIGPPCDVKIAPDSLPKATVNTPYSASVSASGGTPLYTFTVAPGTPFSISPEPTAAAVQLSGTPLATGCVDVSVKAVDAKGCIATKRYCIEIVCPDITVLPVMLEPFIAGVSSSQQLSATPIGPNYVFTATGLPSWLTLSGSVLRARPARAAGGVQASMPPGITITVTATDPVTKCSGSRTYTLQVICDPSTISPASLPNGIVGVSYSQTITASGGAMPYRYTVVSGSLPPGITLSAGGALTGPPSSPGTFSFSVIAADAGNCTTDIDYTIIVTASACPPGTTITLSPAALSPVYPQAITPIGGTAPYTFAVTGGALPGTLVLNPATGVLSGSPGSGGSFVVITATDANGCQGSQRYVFPSIPALGFVPLLLLCACLGAIAFAAIGREM